MDHDNKWIWSKYDNDGHSSAGENFEDFEELSPKDLDAALKAAYIAIL